MKFCVVTSNVLETLIVNCLTFLQAISVVLLSDFAVAFGLQTEADVIAMKDV